MTICYTNVKLIKPDGGVTSGYVEVADELITAVEYGVCKQDKNLSKAEQESEIIDCDGGLLIPGLINMHTHSGMTFLRSRADDKPLEEWLKQEVFPYEAKLTPEDQYWFTKLAMLEYLQSGTTTCFDMYLNTEATAKASADIGFRTVICGSVNDFGGTAEDLHNDIIKYGGQSNSKNSLTSFRLGFHAGYTTSRGLIEEIINLSHSLKEPIWTHLCETKEEVQGCLKETGKYPLVHFNDLKMWKYGGGIFHGVHLTQGDIKVLKKRGLTVVSCPSSNLKLTSGIAGITTLQSEGVNICIGTDNPASNNQLSMLKEMYLTSVLAKNESSDPTVAEPLSILKAATKNAAKALNLNTGKIKVGKLADFTIISQSDTNTLLNDPLKNLVYSCDTRSVIMTVINGKIRYDNRVGQAEFTLPNGETQDKIYDECKARTQRIFKAAK